MARKIKFALEMADGAKVRGSIEELREHFDLEKAVGYFLSGKLLEWLEDRFYEDEAEAIEAIDKDASDLRERLCEALGVPYEGDSELDVEALERLNEKKAILRQKTGDEEIIAHAAQTAFNQEDLADLLEMGEPVIYLCGEKFNIPARAKSKKYVGILGTPTVSIKANSQEELTAKGIVFENVTLPWAKEENKTLENCKNQKEDHPAEKSFEEQKMELVLKGFEEEVRSTHPWVLPGVEAGVEEELIELRNKVKECKDIDELNELRNKITETEYKMKIVGEAMARNREQAKKN